MRPDAPFNGRTGLMLRVAAVVVPLSLLLSSAAALGAVVTSQRLDGERHDRCVTGRTDTQAAIVAGMEAAGVRDETQRVVADAVAEALPTSEC